MIKTNGQIKELGPRNAVYWWLYCNGGGDNKKGWRWKRLSSLIRRQNENKS